MLEKMQLLRPHLHSEIQLGVYEEIKYFIEITLGISAYCIIDIDSDLSPLQSIQSFPLFQRVLDWNCE